MRKKPRILSTFLLLLFSATALTCWSSINIRPHLGVSPELTAALLTLAAADPGEAAVRTDVDDLLAATHPQTAPRRRFYLQIRRLDRLLLPFLRRSLLSWLRSRRRPHTTLIPDLLAQIKRPIDHHYGYPDTGRPYASCAVVGNSGRLLLRSDLADLIDAHDLVVRLNNARTAGFERHVGFKTSLSFINSNVLHLCARRPACPCRPYGHFVPVVFYVCQPAHFIDYVACNNNNSSSPLLVTDPRLDALCSRIARYYSMKRFVASTGRRVEEWREARDEGTFHYSSGMQAVVLAAGICDEVSLFGFGKSPDAKHHYHTNQKVELALHDYEAEYAFYHDLVDRPEVIPFLKDSGFKTPRVVLYY